MKKSTMTDLVEELLKVKQYPEIVFMIQEAKAGEYHDFKNKKYACGKAQSAGMLDHLAYIYKDIALQELSARIKAGEFDEEANEEDKANMRRDLYPNLNW
jgi:hypothetical protein